MTQQASVTPEAQAPGLASLVGSLAHHIDAVLSPGDVAALRRSAGVESYCPAFWRLSAAVLEPGGAFLAAPAQGELEERWAAILSGMAEMRGLHRPERRAGEVLGTVVSEPRFLRLLRGHGQVLLDALRVVAHHLASRAQPIDWTELARLVLSDGREDEQAVRRRLARDYYRQAEKA
jgi:CRISPR type I-E-associated protein CasB/Cse2